MTPTSLFILTTCCLTAILAIVLLLWHRESRRLGASNADAEARERDAAARLSAAEARLAAAEQAVSAERELRQRYEAQAQALTEQRTRTEARPRRNSRRCGRKTPKSERPRRPSAKSWRRLSGRSSKTSRPKFWANTLCASAKPVRSRSTVC